MTETIIYQRWSWRTLQVLFTVILGVVVASSTTKTLSAQESEARLKANRDELTKIRREREELERKMDKLRFNAHTLKDELQNLDRQQNVTKRAMKSLDRQLVTINDAVKETTVSLIHAEDEAATKRAILRQRLVDIYKRGPMYDVEAMLAAQSFGELVARYKYLHELTLRDRALVRRMDELRTTIKKRRGKLVVLQADVQENRQEKEKEEKRLQLLEKKQEKNLRRVQADQKRAAQRMKQLAQAEARVNNIIGRLEAERRRGTSKASAVARGASSIKTSDYGTLAWPVSGDILYNFGRTKNPNGTVVRWNGIGIAADAGTPVKSVAAGEVRVAETMGAYGKTVIIEHGGGDYSVYGSLNSIRVKQGTKVSKGQVIGTVGVTDPDQPPHLHFEIRHQGPAVDPATWLRSR